MMSPMLCLHWICSEIGCSENSSVYRIADQNTDYINPNMIKNIRRESVDEDVLCATICTMNQYHYFVFDAGR